jgi:predicted metalloprotease
MRLDNQRESDNVEDVRNRGGGGLGFPGGGRRVRIPVGGASGGGLSGIVLLVVLFFALKACGIDPLQILAGGGVPGSGGQLTQDEVSDPGQQGASDQMKAFVSKVLGETEDAWNGIFASQGAKYEEPKLVLFSGQVRSACGFASAASGPFYCPNDRKIYLDTDFFRQLEQQFGASGDFAEAYVIAHEVGHHVQNLIGVLPRFNEARQQMTEVEANQMSIRVELQADCFAGVWGKYTAQKGLLDAGDPEEALNAAEKIGDDNIQKRMQGYVVPESFNHGTSQQRQTWFARGFNAGKIDACDTFNNPV